MFHKNERIVYIVYHDGIPHEVLTAGEKGYCSHFDFNFYYGDKTDIRYYHSGSGGHMTAIYGPQYVDGCTGVQYWMAEDAKFQNEPKNCTRIKKPLLVKGWRGANVNPFEVSDETNSYEYCGRCKQNVTDRCYSHQYYDDDDVLRYIDNNEAVE